MVKNIFFILVSAAIIAVGYMAFEKLSFWERSVRIFRMDNNREFSGRPGRGFDSRGEFRPGRGDFRQLPDSLRQRFGQEERFRHSERIRSSDVPGNLPPGFADGRIGERGNSQDSIRRNPGRIESGFHGDVQRGNFRGGKKVNLQDVGWFLAVFSSFTVITICFDKLYRFLRMGKQ